MQRNKAAVLGHPVAHSLSPVIHHYWLKAYGIAGEYAKIDSAPEEFSETIKRLQKEGYAGCNVTLPHKEAALALADEASDEARAIGAANCLLFKDGGVYAMNTDAYGFAQHLLASGVDEALLKGKKAMVLGAGGAAKAVIYALNQQFNMYIYLANRTRERAEALKSKQVETVGWEDKEAALKDCILLVNTTSLGMKGQEKLEISLQNLPQASVIYDIVYNPLETSLLVAGKQRGCRTIDGLGMLLHQAAPSFEAFFGKKPTVDKDLRAAVLEALKGRI